MKITPPCLCPHCLHEPLERPEDDLSLTRCTACGWEVRWSFLREELQPLKPWPSRFKQPLDRVRLTPDRLLC